MDIYLESILILQSYNVGIVMGFMMFDLVACDFVNSMRLSKLDYVSAVSCGSSVRTL